MEKNSVDFKALYVGLIMALVFFGEIGMLVLLFRLLFSSYNFLLLPYVAWICYDYHTPMRGGRRKSLAILNIMADTCYSYFPCSLIKTAEIPPDRNYIIANHPHGLCAVSTALNFVMCANIFKKNFPGITAYGLTLTIHFFFPLLREILLSYGACSVDKESINYIFTKRGTGNALIILPGGNAEALESRLNSAVLVLKNRKGFVKMAIQHGASLVPVYHFGETKIFSPLQNPDGSLVRKIQNTIKKLFGIALVLGNGRGIFQDKFGILPRKVPITTVVGKPIDIPKIENPTEEIIDKYHAIYVENLTQLYEEYKVKLGGSYQNEELVIM